MNVLSVHIYSRVVTESTFLTLLAVLLARYSAYCVYHIILTNFCNTCYCKGNNKLVIQFSSKRVTVIPMSRTNVTLSKPNGAVATIQDSGKHCGFGLPLNAILTAPDGVRIAPDSNRSLPGL